MYVYFPKAIWVNLFDFTDIIDLTNKQGTSYPKSVSNDHPITYVKGGSIVPWMPNTDHKWKTTTDFLENSQITLIAVRDENGQAHGELLVDDGISYDSMNDQKYDYHEFQL